MTFKRTYTLQNAQEPYWTVHRNSYQDYNGEYRPVDSWTAVKTIPGISLPRSSHAQLWADDVTWHSVYEPKRLDIKVVTHISGVRRGGRCRPAHWYVDVEIGCYRQLHLASRLRSERGLSGSCNSLASAMRKVDASSRVPELIQLKAESLYRLRLNQMAMYRVTSKEPVTWSDPVPDQPPTIEPYALVYMPIFGSISGDLPSGVFVGFSWYNNTKHVSLYRSLSGGFCSSCSPAEHKRFLPLFPDWLTPP